MDNKLENRHGFRNIWPFVPVYSQELEGWIDSNAYNGRGNDWIRKVADSKSPSADELRIVREAFALDPENLDQPIDFDPNNLSHATVIAPLRKLGILSDEEIQTIIERAEISLGVSGHAGTTTFEKLLKGLKDSNGVRKNPGLRVLDELTETGTLSIAHVDAITSKKTAYVLEVAGELCESMGLAN